LAIFDFILRDGLILSVYLRTTCMSWWWWWWWWWWYRSLY